MSEKISKILLIWEDWKYVNTFADCEVWGKENKRMIWNPKNEEIVLNYEMEVKNERMETIREIKPPSS